MPTIKLQTNIAVLGTVKYMDYYPAKMVTDKSGVEQEYAAQISLKGTWDGQGEGVIYLPQILANDIIAAGLAQTAGEKVFQGQTVPQFKWLYQGRVQVLKAEEGRTKRTSVLPIDAAPAAAGAVSPPPAVGHGSAGGQAPRSQPATTPASAPPLTGTPWNDMQASYCLCAQIAREVWGDQFDAVALVAATATLFIESNKRGLGAKMPMSQTGGFDHMPAALTRADPMPWER